MTEESEKLLLRAPEAAKLLSISERTLWTLTQEGTVPHIRLRGSVRYPVEQLREWITSQSTPKSLWNG